MRKIKHKIKKKKNELSDYYYQLLFTYVIMIIISFITILCEWKNNSISFEKSLDIFSDSLFPTTITFLACLLIEGNFYRKHRFWYSISILIIMVLMANYIAYMSIKYSREGNHIIEIKMILFAINLISMVLTILGIIKPYFTTKERNCDGKINSDERGMSIDL